MIGQTLGARYKLARLLGQGGMGAVYEAEHTGTGRRVAIKVISPDVITSKGVLRRFEIEARAAGRVESQHIAQVLDVGVDDATGAPFLAIEYLQGADLSALIGKQGPLEPSLALRIVGQACRGLEKAHEKGILHRDIKPANLFMTEVDDDLRLVKILDFGIAKLIGDEDQSGRSAITRTGTILGSPLYMSPEQSLGGGALDQRTDVWSLGVVLFEMLTGVTPFDPTGTVAALLVAISTKPVPSVREKAPWVSAEIALIVERALRKDANERYGSATELLTAIRTCLPNGLTIHGSDLTEGAAAARTVPADQVHPDPRRTAPLDAPNDGAVLAASASPPSALESRPAAIATLASPPHAAVQPIMLNIETSAGVASSQPALGRTNAGRRSRARVAVIVAGVLLVGGLGIAVWLRAPDATARGARASSTPSMTTAQTEPTAAASQVGVGPTPFPEAASSTLTSAVPAPAPSASVALSASVPMKPTPVRPSPPANDPLATP